MNPTIEGFLKRARAGEAVYTSEVRRAFGTMLDTVGLGLTLTLPDGSQRNHVLTLPRLASLTNDERGFVEGAFLAELYNRLSALGPRELEFRGEPGSDAGALYALFVEAFGLELPRSERQGYGRAVNVLERMLDSLEATTGSRMRCRLSEGEIVPPSPPQTRPKTVLAQAERALAGVTGRTLLGVDVGGSDIKLAVSQDGRLTDLVEFDWFPAQFTRMEQLIDPLIELVKTVAEAHGPFDGIGLSFPDVVVNDAIVGGEVYKTRGIRDASADYETEFRSLTRLSERWAPFLKAGGLVATVNDGPMAAFTAVVEAAVSDPDHLTGLFAHTLGTELGTGWVTDDGEIPNLPLEVYNFIIDLGSYPERLFDCDDVRSVANFNTRLPGTLQKYTSQSGAFRLALKKLANRPDLLKEITDKGFVAGTTDLFVPTEPHDLRKPFLDWLMALPDRGEAEAAEVFREIGEYLAVAAQECDGILQPGTSVRVLFGRMVKNTTCFRLMVEGAARIDPTLQLVQAADGLAASPLMLALKDDPHHTVAQFAQAVGAVYYVASRITRL